MAIRLTESKLRQIVREEVKRKILGESIVDFIIGKVRSQDFSNEVLDKRAAIEAAAAEIWPKVKAAISPRVAKNAKAKMDAGGRTDLEFRILDKVPEINDVARKNGLRALTLSTVLSIALMNEMPDEGLTTTSAAAPAAPATPAAPAVSVPKADSKATKFPLDKIAFAEQRPDDVEFPEPNNARENALLNSIIEHFMGGEIRLTEADCSMIQDFLKRKIYSDVFMEPTVRTVYRGMTVGEDFIKKLGVLSSYLSIKPGKIAAITSPRTVDPLPNAYATSWSTAELGSPDDSQSVVWNFATGETSYGRQGGNIGVVLCADVSANRLKFFDAQPLYGLDGMPGVEDEMEAVGMGPIVCRKIYIMKPS